MTRFTVATWRRDAGAKGRDGRTAAVVWARGEVGWTRGGSRDGERGDLETHLGSQGVKADDHCCSGFSLVVASGRYSLVAVASLAVKHGL